MNRVLACATLAVVILPLCFGLTTLLPNTFMKFTPGGIASVASLDLFESETVMGKVVPERDDAFMKSWNWVVVQNQVVLKFFPDTVLFYGFLETLAAVALAATLIPSLGRALGQPCAGGLSMGEVLGLFLLVVMLILWTIYWLHDHNYHDGKATMDLFASERVARWFGLTGVLFMSLALLPASKNSLWLRALGISWERGLWLHRCFGAASLFSVALHVVCFWIRWAQLGVLAHDILRIFGSEPTYYPMNGPKGAPSSDNWTIVLMQLIGYPAFFIMALPPLWRRRNYEAFKYLHYAFLVLIPATLLHAESAWYFMLGGVAFWLVDIGIRSVTAFEATPLLSATAHDAETGVTELVFKKHFEEPGQYCFINVPAVSLWEWHPFSLCSSPADDAAQMCIKNMGPGSFTGRLFELVKSQPAGGLVVNVDGPYGPPLDLEGCEALLLLAGGIGITPVHSSFRTLAQLARKHELPPSLTRVELVWSGRSAPLFSILLDSLKECLQGVPQDGPTFRVRLFLDNPDPKARAEHAVEIASLKGDSCPPCLEVSAGRPALGALCAEIAGMTSTGKALFQVCGPPGMAAAAEKAAAQHSQIQFESQLFVL